jgi:hypothetical protein
MPVELTVDQEALQALARALASESDGKKLRRDLAKQLREALEPMRGDAKSNLMAISSAGLSSGGSLRQAVANQMKAESRLSGRSAGARLRVRRKGMPRGFDGAGKALNQPKGWRHPVYGNRQVWVNQVATPSQWFSKATGSGKDKARKKALEAMENMAKRIAKRGPFTGKG